jgi:hypothetical protein
MAKISLQELRNIVRKEIRKTLKESNNLPKVGGSNIEDAIYGDSEGATKKDFGTKVRIHTIKKVENDNTTKQQLGELANGYINTSNGWGAEQFAEVYLGWNQKDFQDLCDILKINWREYSREKS